MTSLIIVVIFTLVLSAFTALAEAVLFSTRSATLEAERTAGGKKRIFADSLLKMKRDIAVPTASILILNTLANTGLAALATVLAEQILGPDWVIGFSLALTFAILTFCDVLPKTYGATHWKWLWPFIVVPLSTAKTVLYPLVWLLQRFSRLFTRGASFSGVTEEEVIAMIRLGAQSGELTPSELELLYAAFHFDDLVCKQIMVSREDVTVFDANDPLSRWLEIAHQTKFTRYPVCRGSLDHVIGLVHIKDLIGLPVDRAVDLKALVRPLRRVPESMSVSRLLRQMQRSQPHMALVVDAPGKIVGIVTLEDVLEEIVGPVQDEFDTETETTEIVVESPQRFVVGGQVLLSRLEREFDLRFDLEDAVTVADLLVAKVGRPVEVGEVIEFDGYVWEVLEVLAGAPTRVRLHLSNRSSPFLSVKSPN